MRVLVAGGISWGASGATHSTPLSVMGAEPKKPPRTVNGCYAQPPTFVHCCKNVVVALFTFL